MPPTKKIASLDADTAAVEQAESVPTTHKLYFIAGDWHVCGRAGEPIAFGASPEDGRPHAFVSRAFGDWLIENDRPLSGYGRPSGPARYEWAPEALAAFRQEEAA